MFASPSLWRNITHRDGIDINRRIGHIYGNCPSQNLKKKDKNMATMYPQHLPASGKSDAERKLFHLLQDYLPSDYTVIWSIDWTMARSARVGGGAHESEIDYLVLHPTRGVLILEVKGGGV